jgi:hypothetical protein
MATTQPNAVSERRRPKPGVSLLDGRGAVRARQDPARTVVADDQQRWVVLRRTEGSPQGFD